MKVRRHYKPLGLIYEYDDEAEPVSGFDGKYRWLSNFWITSVPLSGLTFRSSEHAYMWHKSKDPKYRRAVLAAPWPKDAKRLGRNCELRSDWERIKFKVMYKAVRAKFRASPHLAHKLLETRGAKLIEENTWDDYVWGMVREYGKLVGKNHLGRILMCVRTELRAERLAAKNAAKESKRKRR